MNEVASADWRIGVDIGGTFTDVVLWREGAEDLVQAKLLTTPDDPSRAVLDGVGEALAHVDIDATRLASVIHGTTLVANALIERKGVTTSLITTAGSRDVLEIGREWRYDLFNLDIDMPTPLVPRRRRLEVTERLGEAVGGRPLGGEDRRPFGGDDRVATVVVQGRIGNALEVEARAGVPVGGHRANLRLVPQVWLREPFRPTYGWHRPLPRW